MRRIYLLFIVVSLLVSGCSKKGKTSSSPPPHTTVSSVDRETYSEQPAFVTEQPERSRPRPGRPLLPGTTDPKPVDVIPVRFSEKETEHVRIVDYNPFGSSRDLAIYLGDLQGDFCYPYPGNTTSDYGMRGRAMHTGVDIKAQPNDTIRAALSGVVRMSKSYSGYGNIVVIRHPCGLETVYAHNSRNLVQPNQIVFGGDPIALAGRTGRATTEHLHFEVRMMGEHFDPNLLLDTQNRTLKRGSIYLSRKDGRILASGSGSARRNQPEDNPVLIAENRQPATTLQQHAEGRQPAGQSSQGGVSVYEVKRGDTFYSISRRFGMTVNELCGLNGVKETDVLRIGQKLKVK